MTAQSGAFRGKSADYILPTIKSSTAPSSPATTTPITVGEILSDMVLPVRGGGENINVDLLTKHAA